ncbi:50S ribosomal protein L4 [Parvularcula sp. ZS-1/3]|uniref:Large ribosomal subunit protein uL4 n=1 Tax=Parvularcula mediterranea TaxID=2732508 RepID=A0A7Y3RJJ8_9PROT|nr:50S ribosomal protein L4 [Parvularcula mediterranea]NNU14835.1 50S ribosomal protein L4 [Parvularcula mediterranea]
MEVDVLKLGADKSGAASLNEEVFGLEPRKDLLHRYVVWQLARRQAGTHKTKERGEVAGSTKKIVRQKGSGGARHGNKKAPQFRGGGKAHGPRVRSHAFDLPKKVRRLALRHALSAKQGAGELIVIDEAKLDAPKTSELASKLKAHDLKSALIMDVSFDENFSKAAKNLDGIDILPVAGTNVYDILKHDKLVLTKAAVEGLEARLLGTAKEGAAA